MVIVVGCDASTPAVPGPPFAGTLAYSDGRDVIVAEVAADGRVRSARPLTEKFVGVYDSLGFESWWLSPTWSPGGDRLAVLEWPDSPVGLVRLVAPDGTGLRPVASAPGNPRDGERATEPVAWSADGRFVAYNGIYGAAATGSLNVVEVATGRVVAQPRPDGFHETVAPAWAPDGARLAVIANGLGSGRQVVFVYEVGAGGAAGRPLAEVASGADPRFNGVRLAWSPDGARIAAEVRSARARSEIVVVDAATGAVVEVGPGGVPVWSPDGGRLAFRGPERELRVYDVSTGASEPVPEGGARWYLPQAWTADGRHVLALVNEGRPVNVGGTPTFVDVETGARVVALTARVHSVDYRPGPMSALVR